MPMGGPDERDTCRDVVRPALTRAGWTPEQVREQCPVQAELPGGRRPVDGQRKRRADYVLELVPGTPLLVIEAKRLWAKPGDGLQQAVRYARLLDAPYALSTNGTRWMLYDAATGRQSSVDDVPTPTEAWDRFVGVRGLGPTAQDYLRSGFSRRLTNPDGSVRELRYYQRRAVHEALCAMAAGDRRILLVMATGAGKTFTALQLVWKLWNHRRRLQRDQDVRNFRVLYLADRDVLVGDPLKKTFRPVFAEAVVRVRSAHVTHAPDVYFATYQALDAPDADGGDAEPQDLMRRYPADFFDLVVVDECHRGSARAESAWRSILEHFAPAAQLGLTATPVDRNGADTYAYFGNPVFTYSLADGIADGFLAPYTIRRVVFDLDADGFEVVEGLRDMAGREIPAGRYGTRDYERRLRLPDRTRAMAARILDVVGGTRDRAVVFCVDAQHALDMCESLRNLRPERTRADPEWVARIMSVEREKDRLLGQFTDPERDVPQVAVTSSLLSTGVDIEDLRYVVIARWIGSVPEFKQIIGRGTRLYPEKGKTEFEIVDFVGATALFRDDEFDGPPLKPPTLEPITGGEGLGGELPGGGVGLGSEPGGSELVVEEPEPPYEAGGSSSDPPASGPSRGGASPRESFVLDGIPVTVVSESFWAHDTDSGRPRLVSYVDWVGERILQRFEGPDALLASWADARTRDGVVEFLRSSRIDPGRLPAEDGPAVDTVDRLLHLAWGVPAMTRAERARRAREQHVTEIETYATEAREVLDALLDRYAEVGIDEIASPSVVQVPPLSGFGGPTEVAARFGGAARWHAARAELQRWLYSA